MSSDNYNQYDSRLYLVLIRSHVVEGKKERKEERREERGRGRGRRGQGREGGKDKKTDVKNPLNLILFVSFLLGLVDSSNFRIT